MNTSFLRKLLQFWSDLFLQGKYGILCMATACYADSLATHTVPFAAKQVAAPNGQRGSEAGAKEHPVHFLATFRICAAASTQFDRIGSRTVSFGKRKCIWKGRSLVTMKASFSAPVGSCVSQPILRNYRSSFRRSPLWHRESVGNRSTCPGWVSRLVLRYSSAAPIAKTKRSPFQRHL